MQSDFSFSVAIPLYTEDQHIERAILSVLHQSFTNYELIIVGDGSTDNSHEKARSMNDERIKIIRQSNQGECVTHNRGTLEASSGLIAFLDADDEWRPNHLASILGLAGKHPESDVFGKAYDLVYDENGKPLSSSQRIDANRSEVLENYTLIRGNFLYNASSAAIIRTISAKSTLA